MAIGNKNQNNGKLYIAKIKSKDEPSPVFVLKQKIDGFWQEFQKASSLSGDLTKIDFEKGEFEGVEYDIVKLYLVDKEVDEIYLLDLRVNLLTRSLFNSILNLDGSGDFKNLSISLYQRKGGDDKTYDAVSLRQNDQLVKWRFAPDEQPKVETLTLGKKKVIDSSKLDDFYLEKLAILAKQLNTSKTTTSKSPHKDTPSVSEENLENVTHESDDIPF